MESTGVAARKAAALFLPSFRSAFGADFTGLDNAPWFARIVSGYEKTNK